MSTFSAVALSLVSDLSISAGQAWGLGRELGRGGRTDFKRFTIDALAFRCGNILHRPPFEVFDQRSNQHTNYTSRTFCTHRERDDRWLELQKAGNK